MVTVRTAGPSDRREVARALAVAFRDDPVIRWMMPDAKRLELLFATMARHQHGQSGGADLAERDGLVVGAALWDAPGYRQPVHRFLAAGPGFTRALRLRTHYGSALETVFHRHRPPGQFWYLAVIGAVHSGQGVGSALLEHRLAAVEGPAYLESSNEANIPLYQRFGFRLTGEFRLPFDGPPCWPMYRD
ncbi:MAG: GNAT family N-acetyltransferase [Actinobacteria bacterium]|nr:GNAT family N-acetyltransferase [Actinomycetota bacterium]